MLRQYSPLVRNEDDSIRCTNPSVADFLFVPSAKLYPVSGCQNLKNETPKLTHIRDRTQSTPHTEDKTPSVRRMDRHCFLSEWQEICGSQISASINFFSNFFKESPLFWESNFSLRQVSLPLFQTPRYLTDGGWSKRSRAAGSFSCKYNTDQPPWPTPPSWVISLPLRTRAHRKLC